MTTTNPLMTEPLEGRKQLYTCREAHPEKVWGKLTQVWYVAPDVRLPSFL